MLHVGTQVAFGSSREFASVRFSVVQDVMVCVFVEREFRCFALGFPCLWWMPFLDAAPVEIDQQFLFLKPFLGAYASSRAECLLASNAFVGVPGDP